MTARSADDPLLFDLIALLLVVLAAMASPGPDMLLVARHAIRGGMPLALACIAGIVAGIGFHLAFALTGLAAIARLQPELLGTMRWLGAAWLVWLGLSALRSGGGFSFSATNEPAGPDQGPGSGDAFLAGLLCNLLNVKVLLMMLALFTELLDPTAPLPLRLTGAGLVLLEVALVWTAFARLIRSPGIAGWLEARAQRLDRVFGILLLAIAVPVAIG